VKVTAIELLADVEHLRAYADVLAHRLNRSELSILKSIAAVLECEQRRRGDDIVDVVRLGRIRQTAEREIDRLTGEW